MKNITVSHIYCVYYRVMSRAKVPLKESLIILENLLEIILISSPFLYLYVILSLIIVGVGKHTL